MDLSLSKLKQLKKKIDSALNDENKIKMAKVMENLQEKIEALPSKIKKKQKKALSSMDSSLLQKANYTLNEDGTLSSGERLAGKLMQLIVRDCALTLKQNFPEIDMKVMESKLIELSPLIIDSVLEVELKFILMENKSKYFRNNSSVFDLDESGIKLPIDFKKNSNIKARLQQVQREIKNTNPKFLTNEISKMRSFKGIPLIPTTQKLQSLLQKSVNKYKSPSRYLQTIFNPSNQILLQKQTSVENPLFQSQNPLSIGNIQRLKNSANKMRELGFSNDDVRDAIKEFVITDPIFSFDEKKNVQMIADAMMNDIFVQKVEQKQAKQLKELQTKTRANLLQGKTPSKTKNVMDFYNQKINQQTMKKMKQSQVSQQRQQQMIAMNNAPKKVRFNQENNKLHVF